MKAGDIIEINDLLEKVDDILDEPYSDEGPTCSYHKNDILKAEDTLRIAINKIKDLEL